MDESYLNAVLENLTRERSIHSLKFKGNPKHLDCLPRFDRAIKNLKKVLSGESVSDSSSQALNPELYSLGLPEALIPAKELERVARALKEDHHDKESLEVMAAFHEAFFKELNELDGFDR